MKIFSHKLIFYNHRLIHMQQGINNAVNVFTSNLL